MRQTVKRAFSVRLNDGVIRQIEDLAKRLSMTNSAVVESAVRFLAERVATRGGTDTLGETAGAWQRDESAAEVVANARKTFRRSMHRHGRHKSRGSR